MGYKYPLEHHKDITIPLIIHYYLREHSEHYTKSFHAKS